MYFVTGVSSKYILINFADEKCGWRVGQSWPQHYAFMLCTSCIALKSLTSRNFPLWLKVACIRAIKSAPVLKTRKKVYFIASCTYVNSCQVIRQEIIFKHPRLKKLHITMDLKELTESCMSVIRNCVARTPLSVQETLIIIPTTLIYNNTAEFPKRQYIN